MPNVAFGSKPIRREEAGLGQAKRRGRPASCREGFGGGPKCLTSPSEAHKKRGGCRLRTGHREPATGLPAALKAVQNA